MSKEFKPFIPADSREPEMTGKAVLLLCETDFITGETIRVDGGRHLQ